MTEGESPEGAPFDSSDPKSVKSRSKSLRRQTLENEAAIRSMFATPEQRRWWWQVLEVCGVFRAELLPADALQFATGQRNIGLLLLGAIPADLYRLMSDEANLKDKQDAP